MDAVALKVAEQVVGLLGRGDEVGLAEETQDLTRAWVSAFEAQQVLADQDADDSIRSAAVSSVMMEA